MGFVICTVQWPCAEQKHPNTHFEIKDIRLVKLDWWIILRCISRRWDVGIWTGFGWPRIETAGGRL